MSLVLFVAAAAQAIAGDGADLKPASARAILAGATACVGATVDPAGQDARMTGWTEGAVANKPGAKTQGRAAMRDDVMLAVKTGIDGGCVVQARTMPEFDRAAFVAGLSKAVGTPVAATDANPVTNLPNGEILVTQIQGGTVMLAFANPNGQRAKAHSKGN